MTLEDVDRALQKIREYAADQDDEAAHAAEDELHEKVLEAIANGDCAFPATLASTALQSRKIKFERRCA